MRETGRTWLHETCTYTVFSDGQIIRMEEEKDLKQPK